MVPGFKPTTFRTWVSSHKQGWKSYNRLIKQVYTISKQVSFHTLICGQVERILTYFVRVTNSHCSDEKALPNFRIGSDRQCDQMVELKVAQFPQKLPKM